MKVGFPKMATQNGMEKYSSRQFDKGIIHVHETCLGVDCLPKNIKNKERKDTVLLDLS